MPCNVCPTPQVHGIGYCEEGHVILRYCAPHYAEHQPVPQRCFRCDRPLRWAEEEAADRVLRRMGPQVDIAASRVNGPPPLQGAPPGDTPRGLSLVAPPSASPPVVLKIDPPRPEVSLGVSEVPKPPLTLWFRCPYGCVFRVRTGEKFNIDLAKKTGTCSRCHRTGDLRGFSTVRHAQVLELVENATHNSNTSHKRLEVKQRVIERMRKLVGSWYWSWSRETSLDELYNRVIQLLLRSELTSNFPTPRIYGLLATGVMKNAWHFFKSSTATAKERLYAEERDAGERQFFGKLFKGFDLQARVPPWRPVYVALNIGSLKQGAAPPYGQSYIVYKQSVMIRSTLTATDSLQMIRGSKKTGGQLSEKDLATIVDIEKILLNVSDRQLVYLCSLADNRPATNPNEFIEVHVWGEVSLSKDVEALVLSETDLENFITETKADASPDLLPESYRTMTTEQRRAEVQRLKGWVQGFCQQFGIKLYFLPLSGATMNSQEMRPRVPAPIESGDISIPPQRIAYQYTDKDWTYDPTRPDQVPYRVMQDARSGLYLQNHHIVINTHAFYVDLHEMAPSSDNWQGRGVSLRPKYRGG